MRGIGVAETKQCQQCGRQYHRGKRPKAAWKQQKYCCYECAYKNTARRPEHMCLECHVGAGIGVRASARLAGKADAGSVSTWRKKRGLKTAPSPSPYWLSLEEKAKRAQEEAFVREQKAWASAGRLACWSNWGQVCRWRKAYRYAENITKERHRSALNARRRHERLKHNPEYKMKRILRNAISRICRKSKTQKDRRVIEYIGCRMSEVRQHIERQFVKGMTWDNHGELWEIDHIVPLAQFDLTELSQRLAANHYTNLQPLWKWQNRAKGGRLWLK